MIRTTIVLSLFPNLVVQERNGAGFGTQANTSRDGCRNRGGKKFTGLSYREDPAQHTFPILNRHGIRRSNFGYVFRYCLRSGNLVGASRRFCKDVLFIEALVARPPISLPFSAPSCPSETVAAHLTINDTPDFL